MMKNKADAQTISLLRPEDGEMEGWRDGRMEGWRDGGMEGWRDGGMEGWRMRGVGVRVEDEGGGG